MHPKWHKQLGVDSRTGNVCIITLDPRPLPESSATFYNHNLEETEV